MVSPTLLVLIIFFLSDNIVGDLEFMYTGFAGSNLLRDGAASVTKDGILSLTSTTFDITGHAFHPSPLPFIGDNGMAVSFSSTFVFAITPNPSGRSGDGMALVISASSDFSECLPGAYIGLVDPYYRSHQYPFFAIELDIVSNIEFKDVDDNHVGIDANSMVSISSTSAGYSYIEDEDNIITVNFEALSLSSGNPMQVWVD